MFVTKSPQRNPLKRPTDTEVFGTPCLEDDTLNYKKLCTRQNPTMCKICKNSCVEKNISCITCRNAFHLTCVGVADGFFDFFIIKNKMPWECPICNIRSGEDTKTKTSAIDEKIQDLREKMETYEKKIDDCEIKLTSQTSQLDTVLNMVTKSSEQQHNKMREFDAKLEATNDKLDKEICYIQGQHRIDELIISGIPHQQNENLKHYVVDIAKVLNVIISSKDIRKIHRLTGQPDAQPNRAPRIPPIMVKFNSQDMRDAINDQYINNMKQKAFLKLSSIFPSYNLTEMDTRIYINPHLPQCLRDIYQKALQLKKDGKIEAVHAKVNAVATKINGTWHKIQTLKELRDAINGKSLA